MVFLENYYLFVSYIIVLLLQNVISSQFILFYSGLTFQVARSKDEEEQYQ